MSPTIRPASGRENIAGAASAQPLIKPKECFERPIDQGWKLTPISPQTTPEQMHNARKRCASSKRPRIQLGKF